MAYCDQIVLAKKSDNEKYLQDTHALPIVRNHHVSLEFFLYKKLRGDVKVDKGNSLVGARFVY